MRVECRNRSAVFFGVAICCVASSYVQYELNKQLICIVLRILRELMATAQYSKSSKQTIAKSKRNANHTRFLHNVYSYGFIFVCLGQSVLSEIFMMCICLMWMQNKVKTIVVGL